MNSHNALKNFNIYLNILQNFHYLLTNSHETPIFLDFHTTSKHFENFLNFFNENFEHVKNFLKFSFTKHTHLLREKSKSHPYTLCHFRLNFFDFETRISFICEFKAQFIILLYVNGKFICNIF